MMLALFLPPALFGQLIQQGSHYDRNLRLLEKIRAEGLSLTNLPFGSGPERSVAQMTGSRNERFDCRISKYHEESNNRTVSAKGKAGPEAFEKTLRVLDGTCAQLHKGWWSYEWCHRRGIHQFHQDGNKIAANWSLGLFPGDENQQHPKHGHHRHIFTGGQYCDEVKGARSTQVQFSCCDTPNKEKVLFTAIEEPSTCSYVALVCSPLLCFSQFQREPDVSSLLAPLIGACFSRHEGWWTYEFCFQKHVRQFHADTVVDSKDNSKKSQVVKSEFVLGRFPTEKGKAKATPKADARPTVPGTIVKVGDDPSQTHFVQEYPGGTECKDERNKRLESHREVAIEMRCGPTSGIASIQEDKTCHYTLKFTTPQLCTHADFKQKELPTQTVKFRAVAENGKLKSKL